MRDTAYIIASSCISAKEWENRYDLIAVSWSAAYSQLSQPAHGDVSEQSRSAHSSAPHRRSRFQAHMPDAEPSSGGELLRRTWEYFDD
ncbi:TPA: hypothetical protein ACHIYU_002613 [Pseudomonas aeruginosa]|jgi:hypothetical protein|uniref:hypothetical protein n=1 Tax=Pseudomonas TaxID=286 RepID=UPI000F4E73F3|nr:MULTISPECIES: hypothetical protein [Pseudomonas]MDR6576661.1 hypothetical protein [Pseudomonas extremaustralis]EKX2956984.1 hypothetical protein [Pseudomonas aeruginosa]MBG4113898.1 hypothetical protein [Pseudomonas aeruginosa]MBI6936972.1 hypothetical protein [Pseudomonas aeruginosa]MBI8014241.1 hypothetical protein [Pseudomonas aeruginosa]